MTTPVTRTKVILPRRRTDLLSRRRLVDLLYELLDYKLIIITAPAGYGKTSLLVDFAHETDLPVCWYSIDALDQEPQRFLAHFIAAISQRFPEFGAQSMAALQSYSQVSMDYERLESAIVNDAYEHIREHFLLVLDDYHLVNEVKEIDNFVNRFIQDVDENCHLILSSRILLTLPDMPLMVARSQVAGLSFEELTFRPDEIQMLVLQNNKISISETIAEELAQETEGWITGLLLSTQTMWQGMVDRLRVARISGVGLYDYLAQQVLEQQIPQVRDFLLHTSYLEEFDVGLCISVFGPNHDWNELIEVVLQNNLFVLPVGEDGRWIRYHHLFRDFLQSRLEQEKPTERDAILQKIGEVYTQRGEWEKAFATYQRLGDYQATARLIDRAGTPLLNSGRPITLIEWLNTLPADVLAANPSLLSLKGVICAVQGDVDLGISLLDQALNSLRADGDVQKQALTLVRRATAYRFRGKYQESYEDAMEVLDLANRERSLSGPKAEALRAIGISLYHMGRMNDALEKYAQSLAEYELINDRQNVAMLLMELGLAYMDTGQYGQALRYYQQSLDYWRSVNNLMRAATLYNNLAVLYHLMGEYSQAAAYYEEGLKQARQHKQIRTEAYILSGIGDLYADLGASDAAYDAYQQARDVAHRISYRFLMIYLDLADAALSRRIGDLDRAKGLLVSAERLVLESKSGYEKALYQLELGRMNKVEGKIREAIEQIQHAARSFYEGGQKVEAARAYIYLAAALFERDDLHSAVERFEDALRLATGLESQHVLVTAGLEVKQFLEALSRLPGSSQDADRLYKQVIQYEQNIPSVRRQLRPHVTAVPFVPPKLTIQAFGRAQVELDGKPVTAVEWQNQKKVREFLFYLLAHPDGLTKEEIGLAFWPDSSQGQLKLQFKNTIYRLRFSLGQDVIAFKDEFYWFNRHLDYEYDVEIFLLKLDQAHKTRALNEKAAALREAVTVVNGSYLLDIDSTWALIERERLRRLYVDATLELARIDLESGDFNTTLEYCHKILSEDKCLEEAHRLAMRAYAAKGNRAGVIRQFESCRQALMEEIQTLPSPQTASLYEALRGKSS